MSKKRRGECLDNEPALKRQRLNSSSNYVSPNDQTLRTDDVPNSNNNSKNQLSVDRESYKPHNNFVNSLLTDLYQITMTYAYWKNKHCDKMAVFDLFFRKCPFKGEYTIFGGLDDVLRFLNNFKYTKDNITSLENRFPTWDKKFWDYLSRINGSQLSVYAQREGSVCFPRVPLLRIEGPIAVCQLIETTLLNLVNYASLITTNACRIRRTVGPNKSLLEFGLRRAQGPDGAMSASKYAYIGGFNGTSNVLAGLTNNIPIQGTHAHSFVSAFTSLDMLNKDCLKVSSKNKDNDENKNDKDKLFMDLVLEYRSKLDKGGSTNEGELAAFIAYAVAYPSGFLALVDTYDTLNSGIPNFIAVSLALNDLGYKPIGIRLDSGDLAYLSKESRNYFKKIAEEFNVPYFAKFTIVASNDINECVLHSLNEQRHEIDTFGIGTHLVTCKRQPALGCVYKLVAIDGKPRIKVSQSHSKMTIPGKKMAYRLWIKSRNEPILDILVQDPIETDRYCKEGKQIICEHPFDITKRCQVTPNKVEEILIRVYEKGKVIYKSPSLDERRKYCQEQVNKFRSDYLRYTNPTPYKVSVSTSLRELTQKLYREEVPVVDYQ